MARGRPKKVNLTDVETTGSPVIEAMTLIGVAKVPGSAHYVDVVAKVQDGVVVHLETGAPNPKAIAIDSAKVSFVREYINRDIQV